MSDKKTELGYTLGVGVEHKLNDKLSLRANYEYVDFGDVNFKYKGETTWGSPDYITTVNQKNFTHFSNLSVGVSYAF